MIGYIQYITYIYYIYAKDVLRDVINSLLAIEREGSKKKKIRETDGPR